MSIIEKAALRLEELRRAGIDLASRLPAAEAAPKTLTEHVPARSATVVAPPSARRGVSIDLARLEASGYINPLTPRSSLADEFRAIKQALLAATASVAQNDRDRGRSIAVTSAVRGEGKSFVTLNLAMSMAKEVDRRIVLVDTDVICPTVFERLGLSPERGLLDVLSDPGYELADALLKTNLSNLWLLAGGATQLPISELLGSDAARSLIRRLCSGGADRLVILDTPPLLSTSEARAIVQQVDHVVLVVAVGTPTAAVQEALSLLEPLQSVSVLLNKSPGRPDTYGYAK
jgi:receptor protein-tyrosine kinase